jgi:hypothetical protein
MVQTVKLATLSQLGHQLAQLHAHLNADKVKDTLKMGYYRLTQG